VSGLVVRAAGPFSTVQDLGRPGLAHLGVPRSGAADRAALRRANRLVGNAEGEAGLEVLAGTVQLEATQPVVVSVTGAVCEVRVDGRFQGRNTALALEPGNLLQLGSTTPGLRAYVGIRGGLVLPAVLGSRSYDQLSDLGPPPLRAGDALAVGDASVAAPIWETLPAVDPSSHPVLRVLPGPRADWLVGGGLAQLTEHDWSVLPTSDRTGLRLAGEPLTRRPGELASEGVVPGSLQVPADGLPILLGPDAGVTGGYPVVAVVVHDDLDLVGQLSPGVRVRFRTVSRATAPAPYANRRTRPTD
jgi:biotin-dependent carboxylase-like uncharacterized protein